MFTDPAVLTGPVAKSELDIRAIGFFLVVPTGLDETAILETGLTVLRCEDRTAAIAGIAARLYAARSGVLPSLSAKREATGSGNGSVSSQPRPSWLKAGGCRASCS